MEKKNKLVFTGLLLVALIMFCLPTYGYAAMHQADTELLTDFSDVPEEEIYNLKKGSSAKELVSEIMKLEESLPAMDEKIAIAPHLTALIDMDNEFSAAELITLIEDEDTDVGLDSAFIKMYVNNGYDVSNLLPLLNNDGIAQEAKEYIVALGDFSSSELSSIYTSHDDSIAVIAMKRIAVIDDQLAFELAASVLSSDNNMVTDEKYIAAFLGVAEYYENHCDDATRDVALVRTTEQFVPIMKNLYDTSSNELLKDQAVYAMARIGNYDLFTYIIESENIDFDLKVSTIERNVDLMVEQVSTTTSLQEIDTIIAAMRLHPIIEVGEALEIAATEGSLASTRGVSEIYEIINFIEKNGIDGVNKSEADAHVAGLGHADEIDTHSVGIGAWKGYAVYRDGVLGNINDHAALMDEDNISHANADNPTMGIPGAVIRITSVKLDDGGSYFGEFVTKDGGYILKEDLDFSQLPTGSFIAEEITPPEGYILSSDVSKVKQPFVWDGEHDVSLVFENSSKVKIQLKKVDESSSPLPGAVFLILRDGQIIGTEETQADGTITVSNVVEGHYEFVEVSAPAGFDCDKTPVGVHVNAEDIQGEQTITVTKVNHHKRSLTIQKRDAESGDPVPGTSFHVRGVNLGYENDVVTGADGKVALSNMPSGCYEIEETDVPKPYILDTNNRKTVWIDAPKDQDVVVDFVNSTRPGLRLLKIDQQTGEPLSEVQFRIKEVNGSYNELHFTNAEGLIVLEGLNPGASDVGVLPWMLLIVGIARVARKADSIVARMGLNPAITGDGLGRGLPGMMAYAVVKSVGSTVAKTVSHSAGKNSSGKSTGPRRSNGPTPGGRSNPPPTPPPVPPSGGGSGASRPAGNGSGGSAAPAGNGQGGTNTGAGTAKPAASYAKGAGRSSANSTTENSSTSTQHNTNTQQAASGQGPAQQPVPGSGAKAQRTAPPGTRRTSVPPGTKTAWQNTPRPSGAGPAPTAAQAASAEKTGSAAAQAHQQEKPERPPIPRVGQNNTGPGRPPTSGGGQAPKGGGRRTSTIHTASQTASTAATGTTSATHTSTQTTAQQQGQASRPIWQNGTPVISPPPGVGVSGKGANSRPKGAGTRKTSAPAQPHVSGETASSGTAGTRRTSAPTQPPIGGRVSPSGTAGTGKAPVTSQPPVSGVAVPSDMAGTRKTSVSTQPPIGGRASPPGTAGMGKAPVSNQPPVNGGATPSGTAGTRKTSVATQPPIGGRAATSGTAGTGKAPVSNQPPVSGEAASSGTAGTRKASAPTQPPIGGRASPSGTAGTGKAPITSQPPVSGGAASSGTAGTHKTAVPSQPPIGGRGAPPGTAGKAVPKSGPNTGTKRVKSTPAQAAMNGTAGHKKNTRRKKGGTDIG